MDGQRARAVPAGARLGRRRAGTRASVGQGRRAGRPGRVRGLHHPVPERPARLDGRRAGAHLGVALTPAGKVLAVDNQNGRIVRYDAAGHFEADFGIGLNDPRAIDVGPDGEIYVADSGNNQIQRYSATGDFLGAFGTSGSGQLAAPAGVTSAPNGTVYVADTNHHRIVRFSAGGIYEGEWGTLGDGAGQLNRPKDVAVDENGRVAIAEPYNRRISQFTAGGA